MCYSQDNNIRKPYKLNLQVSDSSVYTINVSSSPIIIGDSIIQIYSGEKYFIEADLKEGQLKNLKIVNEIINPKKTMEIEFKQISKNHKHSQMILSITNPFNKDLYYHSSIYLTKHSKWINTDVLPVKSGLKSFETWPDIISSITISNFILKK